MDKRRLRLVYRYGARIVGAIVVLVSLTSGVVTVLGYIETKSSPSDSVNAARFVFDGRSPVREERRRDTVDKRGPTSPSKAGNDAKLAAVDETKPRLPGAASEPPTCPETDDARRQPILALFTAWEQLRPELYAEQWTADARQYYGHGKSRDLGKIVEDRIKTMGRLSRVTVEDKSATFIVTTRDGAEYSGSYAMTFYFKNGNVLRDSNTETYLVVCDAKTGSWKIRTNKDQKP